MYNISRGLHPLNFANMFRMNSDVHSHNTRQRDNLHVIQHRTLTREGCIRIFGVKLWNAISDELKHSEIIHKFKRNYNNYLIMY